MSTVARTIKVARPGQLAMETVNVPAAAGSQVVVKMLAAPISEYDAAVVSGRAGPFSGTAGNEGVGIVTSVGSGVNGVNVNDWVVPASPGLGTFSEYVVTDASKLQVVPNDIAASDAALVGGTGCTALRLVSDFGSDPKVIVQNAANSPVGQAVIQIAKAKGIKTINIFPDGANDDAVVTHLQSLGGDIVVSETYANSAKFAALIADLPAPSVGINGAGGASATAVARTVGEGATVVTYGGTASVHIPTSVLVRKGVTLTGFSLARHNASASADARAAATEEVVSLVQDGALKSTVTETPFSDFFKALDARGKDRQATAASIVLM